MANRSPRYPTLPEINSTQRRPTILSKLPTVLRTITTTIRISKMVEEDIQERSRDLVSSMKTTLEKFQRAETIPLSIKRQLRELMNICFEYKGKTARELLAKYLLQEGAGEVFAEYFVILRKKTIENPQNTIIWEGYLDLRNLCVNVTDAEPRFCDDLCGNGLLQSLTKDLQDPENESRARHEQLIKSSLAIMFNCAKHSQMSRKLFKTHEVKQIAKYATGEDSEIQTLAVMVLGYVMDDMKPTPSLPAKVITIILKLLRDTELGKIVAYFTTEELLGAIICLANNDGNSRMMVENENSVLPLLEPFVAGSHHSGGSHDEDCAESTTGESVTQLAVECVWELSFSKENRLIMSRRSDLMASLRYIKTHGNRETRKAAKGTLWNLNESGRNLQSMPEKLEKKHVMISYQWDDQETITWLWNSLRQAGYNVWFDREQAKQDLLQSMADAVENAAIVLVCMSRKYKNSPSCRSEASYAYARGVPIIPLKLERDYEPDGWLGLLANTRVYYDFSTFDRERSLSKLKQAIENNNKDLKSPIPHTWRTFPNAVGNQDSVKTWNVSRVKEWAASCGVRRDALQEIDGKMLFFLMEVMETAPSSFYRMVKDELKLVKVRDVMTFTYALRNLKG